MRGKALKARQDRNLEIGRRDAENRCAVCKRNLLEVPAIIEDFLVRGKCCSDDCLEELIKRSAE